MKTESSSFNDSHCRVLLLIVSLIFSVPCKANLGDTLDQCIKEWGKPTSQKALDNGYMEYAFVLNNSISITAQTAKAGIVEWEAIKTIPDAPLSDADVAAILKMESKPNDPWTYGDVLGNDGYWSRRDGAMASYNNVLHVVNFCTKASP